MKKIITIIDPCPDFTKFFDLIMPLMTFILIGLIFTTLYLIYRLFPLFIHIIYHNPITGKKQYFFTTCCVCGKRIIMKYSLARRGDFLLFYCKKHVNGGVEE